jgi:hypothetical protein
MSEISTQFLTNKEYYESKNFKDIVEFNRILAEKTKLIYDNNSNNNNNNNFTGGYKKKYKRKTLKKVLKKNKTYKKKI